MADRAVYLPHSGLLLSLRNALNKANHQGKRWRIYEVGISYAGRGRDEGKKISWLDGFPALWAIVKYRFFG